MAMINAAATMKKRNNANTTIKQLMCWLPQDGTRTAVSREDIKVDVLPTPLVEKPHLLLKAEYEGRIYDCLYLHNLGHKARREWFKRLPGFNEATSRDQFSIHSILDTSWP